MAILSDNAITVNRYKTGAQSGAKIAALDDGGWVATWTSDGQDGSGTGIYQQIFNAKGNRVGAEMRVNTATVGNQVDQEITLRDDGGWFVSWVSHNATGSVSDIYQRIYNADGTASGQQKVASNPIFEGLQNADNQDVTLLRDGGWVVTYHVDALGIDQNWNTYPLDNIAQTEFDPNGMFVSGNYPIGGGRRADVSPEVTAMDDGGWFVTYVVEGKAGVYSDSFSAVYDNDIYLRFFQSNTPGTMEIRVNDYTTGDQNNQQVTKLRDGGWAITWVSDGQDGSGRGIYQKLYSSQGVEIREETRVNSFVNGDQYGQQVTALPNGGWVVTWISNGQDGSGAGIYQKTYDADGTARSGEVQVNTYTIGDQNSQQVTTLAEGGWVVTWQSPNKSGIGYDIYQHLFKSNGDKYGSERVNLAAGIIYNEAPQITALHGGGWVIAWEAFDQDGMGGLEQNIHQQHFWNSGAPVITSNGGGALATIRVAENGTSVTHAKATDLEKKPVDWSITGGEDANRFRINHDTGVLSFKSAPNHDAPSDTDKNNIYNVAIKATDADNFTDVQRLEIVVSDIPGKTLAGNGKNNHFVGSAENDVLSGGEGNDVLNGVGDSDKLHGGSGNDRLEGGSGNDGLYGDDGADKLIGGAGNDRLFGGDDIDVISASDGNDVVYGENGNDIIFGENGADRLDGGKGNDVIDGGAAEDIIWGQAGTDVLVGGMGNDTIYGGSGSDSLLGGRGKDAMFGGSGSDIFNLAIPKSMRGQLSEIDTIYDFQKGSDLINLSLLSWVSDTDTLSFREIPMNVPNSTGGVTLTSGIRVYYEGVVLMDVVGSTLGVNDFIL